MADSERCPERFNLGLFDDGSLAGVYPLTSVSGRPDMKMVECVRADIHEAEVERLREERDRAVETRENANAVSVRVEIENRQLRERAERAEAALREISHVLGGLPARGIIGARYNESHVRRAFNLADRALASVPSSLDAPKPTWDPPMGQRPTSGNPAVVDAPKEQNDG